MSDRDQTLGEVAYDVLRRLAREILARKPGGHLVPSRVDRLVLEVPLSLEAAESATRGEELYRRLERLLDDEIQRAAVFRPGHAYCHRCHEPACEHSRPGDGRQVFVGYAPTGSPLWQDFAQRCLDEGEPEVDRLFDQPPALILRVEVGADLRGRLLDAFESPRHRLRGQLTAGFFSVRRYPGEGREVMAATFQVVESRGPRGAARLGLNILAASPRGEAPALLWEREGGVPWQRSVRWAQEALADLSRRSGRGRRGRGGRLADDEKRERIQGILSGFARRLARELRGRGRRTRHAELRHQSGERPTRMAVDDARAAAEEAFLIDEGSGTLVVLGERGRTHFFTPDGRLVSSVRYSREAIGRKRRSGLWRRAESGAVQALMERLGAEG